MEFFIYLCRISAGNEIYSPSLSVWGFLAIGAWKKPSLRCGILFAASAVEKKKSSAPFRREIINFPAGKQLLRTQLPRQLFLKCQYNTHSQLVLFGFIILFPPAFRPHKTMGDDKLRVGPPRLWWTDFIKCESAPLKDLSRFYAYNDIIIPAAVARLISIFWRTTHGKKSPCSFKSPIYFHRYPERNVKSSHQLISPEVFESGERLQ